MRSSLDRDNPLYVTQRHHLAAGMKGQDSMIFNRLPEEQGNSIYEQVRKVINQLLRVKRFRNTPYYPMCNSLVENLNATLTKSLRNCA